ncbi:MAG: glycosyltransferase, partial [Clostridia bacterium]|nr:glycosyltransferase [Clostridia bacterium]
NTRAYDPASDAALAAPYSALDLCGKEENKTALQDMLGLNQNPNVPMVAMVSRLVPHKGFDLVAYVMEELLQEDVQVVILGKGERRFEEYFQFLSAQYPGKIAALITYNSDLAHKIYAGADIFLMPSKSEPCGLAQMIACRYGTVPVVRNTGGLADSIRDYNDGGEGFLFDSYNAHDMLGALRRALGLYRREPLLWHQLCKRIMGLDFSWAKSAGEYYELYRRMCQRLCQGCDTKTGYTV